MIRAYAQGVCDMKYPLVTLLLLTIVLTCGCGASPPEASQAIVNALNAQERCQHSLNNFNDINIVNGIVGLHSTGQPINGVACFYSINGSLYQEDTYKNGIREGYSRWYYESGSLKEEEPYKNGMRNGINREYYENGILKQEIPYRNNKREGDGPIYTEAGRLWGRMLYKNDELVGGVCGDGRVLTNTELINMENGLTIKCVTIQVR